jgi:6-pyruvoyltetrahydropterin/6-carboxytetrahydropterin synthase
MPFATVIKKSVFDAAHRNIGFGDGHKCANIHGHTFNYEVAVRSEINEETGLSLDFGVVKDIMKMEVDLVLDHKYLNQDVAYFRAIPPSAENIARFIFKQVSEELYEQGYDATVEWVKLDETPTSAVLVRKEDM